MSMGFDLLEQMACDGECPGELILKLQRQVEGLEEENGELGNACECMRDELKEGLIELQADPETEETVAEAAKRIFGKLQCQVAEAEKAIAGLQRIVGYCKGSVHVTVNGHTTEYVTVEKYFAGRSEHEEFDDDDRAAIVHCIAAGVIFDIQAYPDTPIGSYTCFGATLGQAVDAMLSALGLTGQRGEG